MTYTNGDTYEGQFVNDLRHGAATCMYNDNAIVQFFSGVFENDDVARRLYFLPIHFAVDKPSVVIYQNVRIYSINII